MKTKADTTAAQPQAPVEQELGSFTYFRYSFAPARPSEGLGIEQQPKGSAVREDVVDLVQGLIRETLAAAPGLRTWDGAVAGYLSFDQPWRFDAATLRSVVEEPFVETLSQAADAALRGLGLDHESKRVTRPGPHGIAVTLGVRVGPKRLHSLPGQAMVPVVPAPEPKQTDAAVPTSEGALKLPTVPGESARTRTAETLERVFDVALGVNPEGDFYEVLAALVRLSELFRGEVLAALFQPAFNAHLRTLPRATLDEKKDLCKWVNTTLGLLGLAVVHPDESGPASLVAGTGGSPQKGRFEFVAVLDNGTRRKALKQDLPEQISLTAARPERKPGWKVADEINNPPGAGQKDG